MVDKDSCMMGNVFFCLLPAKSCSPSGRGGLISNPIGILRLPSQLFCFPTASPFFASLFFLMISGEQGPMWEIIRQ